MTSSSLYAAAFAAAMLFASFASTDARAAALWVMSFESRLPFSSCVRDIDRVLRNNGMTDIGGDAAGVGGTKGNVRAHAVCVRRQKAGPCNTDGLSVVISAAGDNVNDTRDIVQRIRNGYGNPVLIDCN
ncbi:MAG: hypothetical protein AB7F41_14055 [Methylocystis sp.]|uniref:hypothetical protein n=1 Tax=Methylocystis sp. TaxID=1911079 RepID=UPI003D152830